MATTYQLVPYLLQVTVRNKPDESRRVDDLLGGQTNRGIGHGTRLQDEMLRIMSAAKAQLLIDPSSPTRSLRTRSVRSGAEVAYFELEPGNAGVVSELVGTREDGSEVQHMREYHDTEFIPVRYALFAPPGAHAALLLAERVGTAGAMSMFGNLVTKNFRAMHNDLILKITPAVTPEVMRKITDDLPVKSLVFTMPAPDDAQGGTMLVDGQRVSIEYRVKAGRRKFFSSKAVFGSDGEDTENLLLGFLASGIGRTGQERVLKEEGWESAVQVRMRNNTTRIINVTRQDAVTMSFPIDSKAVDRPTDEEFQAACASTVEMLAGQYLLRKEWGPAYTWADEEWSLPAGVEPWKVVWDDVKSHDNATAP